VLKLITIITLLLPVFISGQSTRFLQNIDSSYAHENSIILNNTVDSYLNSGLGQVKIDYNNVNQDLFNAAVFFAINKERRSRKKQELTYEPLLEFLAYNCVNFYSKSKFKLSYSNNPMYEKNLYLAARNMDIKCHLFSANTNLVTIMDLEPKRKYHKDSKDSVSTYRLYYRNPIEMKDEPEDIVEPLTYDQFAASVVKTWFARKNRKKLISESYKIMACYVMIEPKSMYKGKAPYARVIQIIGAKRLSIEK